MSCSEKCTGSQEQVLCSLRKNNGRFAISRKDTHCMPHLHKQCNNNALISDFRVLHKQVPTQIMQILVAATLRSLDRIYYIDYSEDVRDVTVACSLKQWQGILVGCLSLFSFISAGFIHLGALGRTAVCLHPFALSFLIRQSMQSI